MASSAAQTQPDRKKPEEPLWPTYSWRTHVQSADTRLLYITNVDQANAAVEDLSRGPMGFDLEWRPNYVKGQVENPVALVQLANENTILLIQISQMTPLLEDPSVVKAGVGIQGDSRKLYNDWGISMRNCVDLSLLARSVDNARWKGRYANPIGLARLVETYEQLSLPKGKVQRSNWEAAPLSPMQQDYAANDAHSGLIVFERLSAMAQAMSPAPKRAYFSFDAINGTLLHTSSAARVPWMAANPEYDPGPPPPPRPPREPRAEFLVSNGASYGGDGQSVRPPRQRGRGAGSAGRGTRR
ncbi:hypothetical protein HWV62_30437 [Athelia sp. TMB]|nr:hypothetical protein HWV62_30437 [Athelia sp. TMB]